MEPRQLSACLVAFALSLGARVAVRKCERDFALDARFDLIAPVCSALCSAVLFSRDGLSLDSAALSLLFVLTCTLAAIDAESLYFPDVLTVPGTLLGVFLTPWLAQRHWYDGLVGALIGLTAMWFLSVQTRTGGVEALGLGNAKFMAMVGAFLGPGIKSVLLLTLCLMLLSVPLLWMAWRGREASTFPKVPTGPYFGLATLTHVLSSGPLEAHFGFWPDDSSFFW